VSAVLGVSAYYHDAAAALVVDGHIVAAMQEERLSRAKHDSSLPLRAIDACLALGDIDARALDAVVFYEDPYAKLERVLVDALRTFPRSLRRFPRAMAEQLGHKIWVRDQLSEQLGVPRTRVHAVRHHESHAASAFFASPFERAAVLTVDGVGEDVSTAIWRGDGESLAAVGSVCFPHSLGLLYAAVTAWLGFRVNDGEYKVMGLAAYGEPTRMDAFERIVRIDDDAGSFELALGPFAHHASDELAFGPEMERVLGPRRPPERPWDLATTEDRAYADTAASLQATLERALLAIARRAKRETGETALCLAGGVALNAVANARLLRESGFERIFVQPAAGDAGGALGAAYLGAIQTGDARPAPLGSPALGVAIDPARAHALATALGLDVERVGSPPERIANELERGAVVALATGRLEWGPRALGHRSILAAPKDAAVRDRINRVIKDREPFRPFAPAVLEERADALFEHAPNDMTRYMTTVCPVRDTHRDTLAAVTHVDGTARVQTIPEGDAPVLRATLEALDRAGLLPVALNTSLNGRGEPIAATADDALAFFLAHRVEALYAGDLRITLPP
jgi:carbamoyltransferase